MLLDAARTEARSLGTVWTALGMSVGVYVVIGSLLAGKTEPASLSRAVVQIGNLEAPLAGVRIFFILAAMALLTGAAWVSRTYLSDVSVVAGTVGVTPGERLASGFAHLRKFSMIAWGCADGVVLAGALLAILSGRALDMLPFAVAGATGLLLLKPEEPSLLELADRMTAG